MSVFKEIDQGISSKTERVTQTKTATCRRNPVGSSTVHGHMWLWMSPYSTADVLNRGVGLSGGLLLTVDQGLLLGLWLKPISDLRHHPKDLLY